MPYDTNNIFAKILRGEIPCKKIYEDADALAFHDLYPKAPVHVLVIPRAQAVAFSDFAAGDAGMVGRFFASVGKVVKVLGLEEGGYRLIANQGINGGQEVPHFHIHILGGRGMGRMVE